jgi:hypothetical protein
MMRTVKAIVDKDGRIKLMEPVELHESQELLVTLLETEEDEQFVNGIPVTALLSEPSLSDWNRPEEDEAWKHLQDKTS